MQRAIAAQPSEPAPPLPKPAAGPRKLTGPSYERFIRVRALLQARYPQIFSWARPLAIGIDQRLREAFTEEELPTADLKRVFADLGAPEGLSRRPGARRSPGQSRRVGCRPRLRRYPRRRSRGGIVIQAKPSGRAPPDAKRCCGLGARGGEMEWWDNINIEEIASVVIAVASVLAAIFWLWGSLIRLPPFPDREVSLTLVIERAYGVLRTASRVNATGALFAGIAALALFVLLVSNLF